MRIAIVGNSHVACFRRGWDEIASDWSDVQIDFFAAAKARLEEWDSVDGGGVWPRNMSARTQFDMTSGGMDRVGGQYDAYLVVGLKFGLYMLMRHMKSHRTACSYIEGRHQLISNAALRATALSLAGQARAVADALNGVAPGRVTIFPNPLPAHDWGRGRFSDQDTAYLEELDGAFRETIAGLNFPVFLQPDQTVTDRYFTRAEYSRGSVGLVDDVHKDGDFVHMNGKFGALCLGEFLHQLDEGSPAKRVPKS